MRILICEDSVLLREGLVRLLDDAGHDVVGALPDADELASTVAAATPDLVVVDVRMPPTFTDEGIQAAMRLRREHPDVAILVLSQYVEERYAADLVASGGAFGYLLKDRVADVADFLASVDAIGAGSTVLDPEVVAQLLARRSHDDRMARLTGRERSVLALMAEGRSNQSIAGALHLSVGGVEKHISSLFSKLGLEHHDGDNRRVLAVLAHLDSAGGSRD